MTQTLKEALRQAEAKIKLISNSPVLDAEVLLSNVIKQSREFFYTHPEQKLTSVQQKKFDDLVSKRSKGVPVAYLVNSKEFYGFDFFVNENVLIPRPETELLIDEVKNLYKKGFKIADIGTGSGCIAITLSKILDIEVLATDLSKEALKIAKINAKRLKSKVKFFQGNLLEPIIKQEVDIIVANLPYGDKTVWKKRSSLDTIGLEFEPEMALYSTQNGCGHFEILFNQIKQNNITTKYILLEMDSNQERKVTDIIRNTLPETTLEIKKDLAGLKRIIIVKN